MSAFSQDADTHRNPIWAAVVLAAVLLVAGALGSTLAAGSIAKRDAQKSQDSVEAWSNEVASTLRLAIKREEDLAVSATGFFVVTPDATNAQFVDWANSVRAFDRYPELIAWGQVVMLTPGELAAHFASATAAGAPAGSLELIPPGDRPFYCLFAAGQARTVGTDNAPAGFDFCAGAAGVPLLAARDTGLSGYQSVDTGTAAGATLSVQVPVYRGGITPTTVMGRRSAFAGWVGISFDSKILLAQALGDRQGTAVALRFHHGISDADFISGVPGSGAVGVTTVLEDGWTVETFATEARQGIFDDRGAETILFVGLAASLVLAALVLVLGTGRVAALRLVGERTGELRHQALHDALTGLPNRSLIMDRIDQLLARNRRNGTSGAALYIDLDDFKNVNDTLGH
ncbi:MAG: diguanylate cyclase, partial [Ilumatobacteraceae bacterium]